MKKQMNWLRRVRPFAFLTAVGLAAINGNTLVQADEANFEAHVAAGEFGAAAELAQQAETEQTKQQLLQKLVHAQIQAGDGAGAGAVIPQVVGNSNDPTRGAVALDGMLNGGVQADFDSLIELIQNETDAEWFEIDGVGGSIDEFESGVRVDPQGILAKASRTDRSGKVAKASDRARVASLNEDMAKATPLRLVSLTRLEQEVSRRLAAGLPVVESMEQMAGLSKIEYVMVYPEQGEIVIGGPAEGWEYDEFGMAVGAESGRPTLQLGDLVTVMRTFSPTGSKIFGCSIDPKQENIKAVKEYAATSQSGGALSPAGIRRWANKIEDLLGHQNVTVYGVPANSRVARVLVEADYRMKLIGVGQLEGGSNVPDYFELLRKQPTLASGGLDAMRWWMTMRYESVMHSADHNAFQVNGSAVQCKSENQFLSDSGKRVNTGKAEPINQLFAANFTDHYTELAKQDPVFADLQGIFDLALIAALIDRDQLDQRAEWNRGVFAVDGAYRPAAYPVPKQVESVVDYKVFNGKDVVLQAAGGVRADLMSVINDDSLRQQNAELKDVSSKAKAGELPEGRWWWDAK